MDLDLTDLREILTSIFRLGYYQRIFLPSLFYTSFLATLKSRTKTCCRDDANKMQRGHASHASYRERDEEEKKKGGT